MITWSRTYHELEWIASNEPVAILESQISPMGSRRMGSLLIVMPGMPNSMLTRWISREDPRMSNGDVLCARSYGSRNLLNIKFEYACYQSRPIGKDQAVSSAAK